MSWSSVVPLFVLTSLIFMVPGALVAWAARARGFLLVASAPALTVSLASVAAILAPLAGLEWSVAIVVGMAVLAAAVAFAISRAAHRRSAHRLSARRSAGAVPAATPSWGLTLALAAAVVISAVLIGRRLIFVFGNPEAISQTFDNVFHLNAVRYILETGTGSTFDLGQMAGNDYYPAAWHDMVALVAQAGAASVPVSVNVTNLFIGAVAWPLGCILLVQQLFGRKPLPILAAGVLSAAFGVFPILMVDFGVLYPNLLSIALLPAVLALALNAMGMGAAPQLPPLVRWLLLIVASAGMTLAHPSSTMALLALLLPAGLVLYGRGMRSSLAAGTHSPRNAVLYTVALLASLTLLVIAWIYIRPIEEASTWRPIQTNGRAIGEVITGSPLSRPLTWLVAILIVAGIGYLASRRGQRWILGMFAILAALYVVVSSFPFGDFRTAITGVWYNDTPRLAALLPVMAVPVATAGTVWIVETVRAKWLGALERRGRLEAVQNSGLPQVASVAGLALVVVLLAYGTQQDNIQEAARAGHANYVMDEDSPLISPDEMELLERVDEHVPEDEVIAGNPWTGTSLAYAVAGRETIDPHILNEISDDADVVYNHLNEADTDPEVCTAVDNLGVGYVLDFEGPEIHGHDHGYVGLDNLVRSGVARLVDREGKASLYELTVCN